jgi:hypothetical protein
LGEFGPNTSMLKVLSAMFMPSVALTTNILSIVSNTLVGNPDITPAVDNVRPDGNSPLIRLYETFVPLATTDTDVLTDSVAVNKNPGGVLQFNVVIILMPIALFT